jgi:hypothetical protein
MKNPKAIWLRRIAINDLDWRPSPLPNADARRAGKPDLSARDGSPKTDIFIWSLNHGEEGAWLSIAVPVGGTCVSERLHCVVDVSSAAISDRKQPLHNEPGGLRRTEGAT